MFIWIPQTNKQTLHVYFYTNRFTSLCNISHWVALRFVPTESIINDYRFDKLCLLCFWWRSKADANHQVIVAINREVDLLNCGRQPRIKNFTDNILMKNSRKRTADWFIVRKPKFHKKKNSNYIKVAYLLLDAPRKCRLKPLFYY